MIGGLDAAGNAVRSVTRIDVRTGKISSVRALAHPLSDAGVATRGGQGWLIGGWRGGAVSQVLRASLSHDRG